MYFNEKNEPYIDSLRQIWMPLKSTDLKSFESTESWLSSYAVVFEFERRFLNPTVGAHRFEVQKQQIKFISKEIHYKKIEENLLQEDIQTRIEKIKNQIETNLYSSIPNAFGIESTISFPYPMLMDLMKIKFPLRQYQFKWILN